MNDARVLQERAASLDERGMTDVVRRLNVVSQGLMELCDRLADRQAMRHLTVMGDYRAAEPKHVFMNATSWTTSTAAKE